MPWNFRFSRGLQAPRRQIANDGLGAVGQGILTFGATSTASAIGDLAFLISVPAATLVRTRGAISVHAQAVGAVEDNILVAYGIIVVSENAVNVGLTAVPDPLVDIENDWFVYGTFAMSAVSTNPAAISILMNQTHQFDSRGQRKLKLGDALALVVSASQDISTTGTVLRFSYGWRQQFKL